jgi:hypothetical protein
VVVHNNPKPKLRNGQTNNSSFLDKTTQKMHKQCKQAIIISQIHAIRARRTRKSRLRGNATRYLRLEICIDTWDGYFLGNRVTNHIECFDFIVIPMAIIDAVGVTEEENVNSVCFDRLHNRPLS